MIAYHDATKHHPQRYARSLGYLDWATQPDPFRRYSGAPEIPLVLGPLDQEPDYDSLYRVRVNKAQQLNRRTISAFLECGLAISAWKQYRESTWALRVNPSSGNLHPTEGYLICGPVEGINEDGGIYHYAPRDHLLELRKNFSRSSWKPKWPGELGQVFHLALSSIFWREAWKYGERAFRYCQHDVGHAVACLRLSAARLGWRLRLVQLGDYDLSRLLGLHHVNGESREEWEHAELLATVVTTNDEVADSVGLPFDLEDFVDGEWQGTPNRLSPEHVAWDAIDMVANSTLQPGTPALASPVTGCLKENAPSHDDWPRGFAPTTASAREVILRRRSATDFDATTTLPTDAFYQMLLRLLPRADRTAAPWDAWPWNPRIHLAMFIHRVEGLVPGLYAFARDESAVPNLRAAMKKEFIWEKPDGCPDCLPLFLLMKADCRHAAAQLLLGQAIAGDSAFSLGMIAEFESALREFGPWFYRRLFWEAGMIGQVLYLEAEAAAIRLGNSLRATGIGAYFDDMVHEVFGLDGHAFQSMYHFTLGGAVDDTRLTTRPAYDEKIVRRTAD